LSGTKYTYKSKKRKLELKFINDSVGILTNTFYCPNLKPEYKIIVQEFTYNRNGDSIYVKNSNQKFGDALFIEIPVQNSKCCDFLNENKRERIDRTKIFYIGPNYPSDFEIYGRIPNLTIDTLVIVENFIFYYKREDRGGFWFLFKKKKGSR
jgi:hypothetical protein